MATGNWGSPMNRQFREEMMLNPLYRERLSQATQKLAEPDGPLGEEREDTHAEWLRLNAGTD